MSPTNTTPWRRDFVSDLKSAPETLSSWDNCMAKSYCKWPVIAAIIVGGVIVISIIACVINCFCCGIQCCKCCGCCSCCCPSPRWKKEPKYLDEPYSQPPQPMPPPVNNPYQPPPPPSLPSYRGAQVARFDTPPSPAGSKMNEDALPPMPTWDSAVTKRVDDHDPHHEAMEMENLPAQNQGPRRMPSAPRSNAGGYMGPPPARTGAAFTSSSYYTDDQSAYRTRSPGVASPAPALPYEKPYGDYHQAGYGQSISPVSNPYDSHQQYMPAGTGLSPTAEPTLPMPYRQPSPAVAQTPGMPYSTAAARPIPYRQPSPAISQSPINRTMTPANAVPPYRSLTPANSAPAYRAMPPPTQEPVYRAMSPPSQEHMYGAMPPPNHEPAYRTMSPPTQDPVYRAMSPPNQEPSYRAMPPPTQEPTYQAMPPPNSEPAYRAMPPPNAEPLHRDMSPSIPSSPPPPFTSSPTSPEMPHDSGRPPSLLQSGRKPAPNSFRDV